MNFLQWLRSNPFCWKPDNWNELSHRQNLLICGAEHGRWVGSNLRICMCENCDSSWHFKGFFSCWLSTGFTLWATNGCLHCHSYRLIQFQLHPSELTGIFTISCELLQMPSTSKSTFFKQSITYTILILLTWWFKPLLFKPYPCRKPGRFAPQTDESVTANLVTLQALRRCRETASHGSTGENAPKRYVGFDPGMCGNLFG